MKRKTVRFFTWLGWALLGLAMWLLMAGGVVYWIRLLDGWRGG